MRSYFTPMLQLSRSKKRLITLLIDSIFLFCAFWLAFFMRLDTVTPIFEQKYWAVFLGVLPVSLLAFIKLGLYRAVLRYMNMHAVWAIATGSLISALTFIGFSFFFNAGVPRTVPFIFMCFCLIFVGGSRIAVRALIGHQRWHKKASVLIYGAGSAGRQLATALAQGPEYHAVAFVDDDKAVQGHDMQGIHVYSPSKIESLVEDKSIEKVLLALPSTSRSRRKEILAQLEPLPVQVQTTPGMADLVKGHAKLEEFKDVGVEDLLGRDPVAPKKDLMTADITGKVVMVTGAGGSIGSELCRQILRLKPTKLVLFELSEFGLYSIDKELNEYKQQKGLDVEIYPMVGSVQRTNRIEMVMRSFAVQTVYHAAAYKHVPLVEHNVVEGVRNNIFGTYYTACAAINANVETFVLISTDKAVRPTNVMGTTKRMAELVLQALSKTQDSTRFCMVRFGNVLGSSGSVVPLFRKQIKEGGPVTLTHPDITRFFMTIPEASQLVIQAGAMGKGGDVFVLDMGESVKIFDLASKMIHLSGFSVKDAKNPNGDIKIKCTGLRPGEKLYEELLIGDNVSGTNHERIMTAQEVMLSWDELEPLLAQLDDACHNFEHERIRELLLSAPTGFNPTDGICDLVWQQKHKGETRTAEIVDLKKVN
ncbi:nucleoside-diphosphate sugar epimerase/dehydratase [Psychrobium sp. 1_MG-2023]|uniref:nucleoside-diphosphate sugar epimerase/dehydratase n=1 Tax=Psychrobium sp. 1_MG-2023 TaxID=3062624 RepID=UPI000C31D468|nr:nucleoside-diphosphate sugar epimerase/dehydratase [Psychrobium sp. 1_MG-2023]MDP2562124.1 nucleoside-diphosphate sugar epimerase/dehydratase [Psychrobium sp. 1_MG-2023]PKF55723.1 nucleoside-diphosphate sugar epimerase [Alteromonadales bacterium alter-6D02]